MGHKLLQQPSVSQKWSEKLAGAYREYLVLCLAAVHNLGMHRTIIIATNVFQCNLKSRINRQCYEPQCKVLYRSTFAGIQLREGSLDELLSDGRQLTLDEDVERIEAHSKQPVDI